MRYQGQVLYIFCIFIDVYYWWSFCWWYLIDSLYFLYFSWYLPSDLIFTCIWCVNLCLWILLVLDSTISRIPEREDNALLVGRELFNDNTSHLYSLNTTVTADYDDHLSNVIRSTWWTSQSSYSSGLRTFGEDIVMAPIIHYRLGLFNL